MNSDGPFRLSDRDFPTPAGVIEWRGAFAQSLDKLNCRKYPSSQIVDVGGGTGWLGQYVNPQFTYTLLDRNAERVAASSCRAVNGIAESLPFDDDTVGLVICVSAHQYFDQSVFWAEARRVLSLGGVLALHENGRYNPIIALGRLARNITGLWNAPRRAYNESIIGYFPDHLELAGFRRVYSNRAGLLTPISFIVEHAGAKRSAKLLRAFLQKVDEWLLRHELFHRFAWFQIVHFERNR